MNAEAPNTHGGFGVKPLTAWNEEDLFDGGVARGVTDYVGERVRVNGNTCTRVGSGEGSCAPSPEGEIVQNCAFKYEFW